MKSWKLFSDVSHISAKLCNASKIERVKKRTIIEELFAVEGKLLEVSTKIKAERFDSIESWIEHLLEYDFGLAQYFLIPNEPHIRSIDCAPAYVR